MNSSEVSIKRRINKLRNELAVARSRWEFIIGKNCIKKLTAQGNADRSPMKTLYVSVRGDWWEDVQDEMQRFQEKIRRHGYSGSSKPRALWMPTTIINPKNVRLCIYGATSVRTVSKSQATTFARTKSNYSGLIPECKKYIIRSTGTRNYKLKITSNLDAVTYGGFTDWAICLCESKTSLPKITKGHDLSVSSEAEFIGAICVHGHSALFKCESMPSETIRNVYLNDDVVTHIETDDSDDSSWL